MYSHNNFKLYTPRTNHIIEKFLPEDIENEKEKTKEEEDKIKGATGTDITGKIDKYKEAASREREALREHGTNISKDLIKTDGKVNIEVAKELREVNKRNLELTRSELVYSELKNAVLSNELEGKSIGEFVEIRTEELKVGSEINSNLEDIFDSNGDAIRNSLAEPDLATEFNTEQEEYNTEQDADKRDSLLRRLASKFYGGIRAAALRVGGREEAKTNVKEHVKELNKAVSDVCRNVFDLDPAQELGSETGEPNPQEGGHASNMGPTTADHLLHTNTEGVSPETQTKLDEAHQKLLDDSNKILKRIQETKQKGNSIGSDFAQSQMEGMERDMKEYRKSRLEFTKAVSDAKLEAENNEKSGTEKKSSEELDKAKEEARKEIDEQSERMDEYERSIDRDESGGEEDPDKDKGKDNEDSIFTWANLGRFIMNLIYLLGFNLAINTICDTLSHCQYTPVDFEKCTLSDEYKKGGKILEDDQEKWKNQLGTKIMSAQTKGTSTNLTQSIFIPAFIKVQADQRNIVCQCSITKIDVSDTDNTVITPDSAEQLIQGHKERRCKSNEKNYIMCMDPNNSDKFNKDTMNAQTKNSGGYAMCLSDKAVACGGQWRFHIYTPDDFFKDGKEGLCDLLNIMSAPVLGKTLCASDKNPWDLIIRILVIAGIIFAVYILLKIILKQVNSSGGGGDKK